MGRICCVKKCTSGKKHEREEKIRLGLRQTSMFKAAVSIYRSGEGFSV